MVEKTGDKLRVKKRVEKTPILKYNTNKYALRNSKCKIVDSMQIGRD